MALLTRAGLTPVVALALVVTSSGPAGTTGLTEAQVRAGFLYNFAMFVEWPAPAAAGDPIVIGVLGDKRFAGAIKEIEGRVINGRQIAVHLLDRSDDLARCSILYVDAADDRSAADALARVGDAAVLSVGEASRFTQLGGIVRLYNENAKLRFEINVTRSQQVNLKISSKLLGLARIVRDTT